MPNHCNNRLTVTGEPKDLRVFVEFSKGEKEPLDYQKLCPMPGNPLEQLDEGKDCHLNVVTSMLVGSGMTPLEEYNSLKESDNPEDQRRAEHILHEAWYNWRILHWNTKWDCYAGHVDTSRIDQGTVVYGFDSAWSPPTGVIRAAAERFNTLEFVLEYAEPGCDFSGVFSAIGDAHTDECLGGVLATEYGRELYQEMFDENQDDCNA